MSESERPGKTVFRLAKSVTRTVRCRDNGESACCVKGSVRNRFVSLSIEGGDGWAHLTVEQALDIIVFLNDAIDEIDARQFADAECLGEVGDENPA